MKEVQDLTLERYVSNIQVIAEQDNYRVDLGRVSTQIKVIYLSLGISGGRFFLTVDL